ncbi:LytR/AlgR family response regulator transcription factor [Echinicola rosea]|uniref:DNA-binding response regulator n=1 Tax=Echinicola rosea TaxID=1807691 RepID=A0ABQ1V846_9BACT|nr:LytTR family transcriptional regulator DNA-binding domain-containing protein [Echinicola rosea]GGF41574.1 DNA-binding response regulator [Echinicola rosea]
MIRTIIIDDEPLAGQLVEEYLEAFSDFEVVAVCHDGFEGLKAIQRYEPDLIFLDVQMPRINGFEMLELIECPPAVIFTTAFDEYAVKAFDSHAIDYLLKPFSQSRFDESIKKFSLRENGDMVQKLLASKEVVAKEDFASRIVLKEKGEIKVVQVKDVEYLEANDDFVNVHSKGKKYMKNRTLKFFESVLDPQDFVRVHRSYIVKISEITSVEPYEKEGNVLRLRKGGAIPVSRSGMGKLKSVLGV